LSLFIKELSVKLRSVSLVILTGILALACGGTTDYDVNTDIGSNDLSAFATTLTEPWASMGLPTDGGSVIYSDSTSVTVTYSGGSVADLGSKYESAVKAAGWTETSRTEMMGVVATYSKDGKTLSLTVSDAGGLLSATLSVF